MTIIPENQNSVKILIDNFHEGESLKENPRDYFSVSSIGHECDRWLWLNFRWVFSNIFSGRMKRLFRRGHLEEDVFDLDLKSIGMEVRKASRVKYGHHISGEPDRIVKGIPESPNKEHIAEYKTHNDKSFKDLKENGVKKSKYMHYAQMQVYMLLTGIDRCIYLAVNKNDDELYYERIRYNESEANQLIERAKSIIYNPRPPERISNDPTWYKCKMCPAHDFCHVSKLTKNVNCRTCAHSTPKEDETWHCSRWDDFIPLDVQRTGCDDHVLHPDLVPWQMKIIDDKGEKIAFIINGVEVQNGHPDANVFASSEIIANPDACAKKDYLIMHARDEIGGKIVG